MGQSDICKLIKLCGGKATIDEIREKAKEVEPFGFLYSGIRGHLTKLKEKGLVYNKEKYWFLKK